MKLDRSQIESLVVKTSLSPDGRDLYGYCPKCGHDEFGISLVEDNHPFSCFRKAKCGFVGNIYTLLKHLGKIKEFVEDKQIDPEGLLPDMFPVTESEVVDLQLQPLPYPPVGWKRIFEHPYLTERGFTDREFQKYQVGVSRFNKEYITFLVYMDSMLVGYISRSTKSKQWIDAYNEQVKQHNEQVKSNPGMKKMDVYPRYKNSYDNDFSKMLFGYDEIIHNTTTDIILVEGPFSKIKTDINLELDSVDWMKCVATFGAKISDVQITLLINKGVRNIWLWFEGDVLDKVKKIANQLSNHFTVKVNYLPNFDPGDIESEQALELLCNAVDPLDITYDYI